MDDSRDRSDEVVPVGREGEAHRDQQERQGSLSDERGSHDDRRGDIGDAANRNAEDTPVSGTGS